MTLDDPEKLYELATVNEDGKACIISDGPTAVDTAQGQMQRWEHRGGEQGHRLEREKAFPLGILSSARSIKIEDGETNYEAMHSYMARRVQLAWEVRLWVALLVILP